MNLQKEIACLQGELETKKQTNWAIFIATNLSCCSGVTDIYHNMWKQRSDWKYERENSEQFFS